MVHNGNLMLKHACIVSDQMHECMGANGSRTTQDLAYSLQEESIKYLCTYLVIVSYLTAACWRSNGKPYACVTNNP